MAQDNNNSSAMRPDIQKFIEAAFPHCRIWGDFNEHQEAWTFKLAFTTSDHIYSINPPQGCCLMQIHSGKTDVTFTIVLFVQDFKRFHAAKMMN